MLGNSRTFSNYCFNFRCLSMDQVQQLQRDGSLFIIGDLHALLDGGTHISAGSTCTSRNTGNPCTAHHSTQEAQQLQKVISPGIEATARRDEVAQDRAVVARAAWCYAEWSRASLCSSSLTPMSGLQCEDCFITQWLRRDAARRVGLGNAEPTGVQLSGEKGKCVAHNSWSASHKAR